MAREMRKQIVERVQKELPALMDAWLDSAKGHFMQVKTPTGEIKVYKKAPNTMALKDLAERALGKPEQPVTGDVSGEVIYRIVRGEAISATEEESADSPVEPINPQ